MDTLIEKSYQKVQNVDTRFIRSIMEHHRWKKWVLLGTFWGCVFLLLFLYLQKRLSFHFFYIEQEQLFLWRFDYFLTALQEPAGLVRWFTEFNIQYFVLPYVGALIMSALFVIIGMLTATMIRRIAPNDNLFIISLLPIVFLVYVHFDLNYFYRGTLAYMLMLAAFWGYFSAPCTKSGHVRLLYVTVCGVFLFWSAGSVAFLFTVSVLLWELLHRFRQAYRFVLPLLLVAGLVFLCVYASLAGEYRLLLLPDGYFVSQLKPYEVGVHGIALYFAWIFVPVLLLLCSFLRNRGAVKGRRKYIELSLQLVLVFVLARFGTEKIAYRYSDFYKELDYYMRTEQWDKITERCSGKLMNYMYKCCLNVALAEKGVLAEQMFVYDQSGTQSIIVPWDRVTNVSTLLSEIYFSMGYIAMAQRMAFEANESLPNANGSRMLQRLIQTNLIFGSYAVAEKYLDILEQTTFYKQWARHYRQFLWNDEAIENDPLLGMKRKCIVQTNTPEGFIGLHLELEQIAIQNPAHQATFSYMGAICLLAKEITVFKELIVRHYGTTVLPVLPKSYQEAVVILFEDNPSQWETFHVSAAVIQRYNEYKKLVLANRNNKSALPGLLGRNFGDTYWYYYMYQ